MGKRELYLVGSQRKWRALKRKRRHRRFRRIVGLPFLVVLTALSVASFLAAPAPERVAAIAPVPAPKIINGGNAMSGTRSAVSSPRGDFVGRVTHVRDGDTIEVASRPIRIANLDCAEMNTVAGQSARQRMQSLVAGQRLSCSLSGRKSYDRWIGTCALSDGRDIGSVMVSENICRLWR